MQLYQVIIKISLYVFRLSRKRLQVFFIDYYMFTLVEIGLVHSTAEV